MKQKNVAGLTIVLWTQFIVFEILLSNQHYISVSENFKAYQ